jgi:hypothetical protein
MPQTTIVAPLPNDGIVTYQRWRIERAPDSAGAPGAYAEIINQALDQYTENQVYIDSAGATDSWYRYRYSNTALTVNSTYSSDRQAGAYTVRDWLRADIPDADITTTDWDRWRDMAIQEFRNEGVGRPLAAALDFTPTSDTDEWVNLPAAYRTIIRVDIYYSSRYMTNTPEWYAWGRKVRIPRPNKTYTYKLWGIGEIRTLADIDDELFPLLYWYMRMKYLDKRIADRQNFRQFLAADKVSDVKTEMLLEMKLKDAKMEYATRLSRAQTTWPIPTGMP